MRKRLWVNADNEGPDQTARMRSLIRACAVRRIIGYFRMFQWRANARMRHFAHVQDNVNPHIFCACSKALFSCDAAHLISIVSFSAYCIFNGRSIISMQSQYR